MRGAVPGGTMMKRILIVDDESLIGYALSASLRRDDTYIKAVECGKDALSEINHIFYNLCFLDIKLPDACGLDLMKLIKKASPSTFIVIMTGGVVNDPELMKDIVANAHLFISKPFDLERVKSFVNRFIGDEKPRLQAAGEQSTGWTGYETFENQRHIARQAVMSSTTCAVVASEEEGEKSFTAGILEMSDTGMCIRTDYQLKPGQLLKFSDNPVLSKGVVRWSKGGGETEDAYHAGIQFIMP